VKDWGKFSQEFLTFCPVISALFPSRPASAGAACLPTRGGCWQRWLPQLCPVPPPFPAPPAFPALGSHLSALPGGTGRGTFPTEEQPLELPPHQGGGHRLGRPCASSPYSWKITYLDKTDCPGGGRGCLALCEL